MQKQKLSTSDVEEAVVRYNELQQKKKNIDQKFNDAKKKFYSIMDSAFDSGLFGDDVSSVEFSKVYNYGEPDEKTFSFKATRVIPTVIEWDVSKLKQKLSTKVIVSAKGEGAGKIEIEFYSHEDLDRLLEMIGK